MAILTSGIVMSHYTHLNLSPVTQITVQHTFRTVAFIAGKNFNRSSCSKNSKNWNSLNNNHNFPKNETVLISNVVKHPKEEE